MAKNVTIAGASYTDVPAVDLPQTGGGTATFTDVSATTAQAADVTQGKQFFDALGVLTQGAASGGGGASNYVTGTFTGTTTNTAIDIDLPYTGSGWPIVIVVRPTEGPYNGMTGSFYSLVHQYAISFFFMTKARATRSPGYSASADDYGVGYCRYKSSNATSYSGSVISEKSVKYTTNNATGTAAASALTVKSNKKLSVFISSPGTYGFAANIEYTYHVIYSS